MPVEHCIAMDTHCHGTDICVKTRANRPGRKWRVATTIPALREVIGALRRWGIVVRENAFKDKAERKELLAKLPEGPELAPTRLSLKLLIEGYDQAVKQEKSLRQELTRLAKKEEVVVRLTAMNGRAAHAYSSVFKLRPQIFMDLQ